MLSVTKWLLIYEFDVKIYRQAPTIRIFFEDTLLNEFILEKKTRGVLEVEYNIKEENKLTIEFVNDDNNYTNGFITKSTYIYPKYFYIVPKCFVTNYTKIEKHYSRTFGKRNYYIYRKTGKSYINTSRFEQGMEYIKHFYRDRTVYPQNLASFEKETTGKDKNDYYQGPHGESKKYNFIFYKKHGLLLLGPIRKGFLRHRTRDEIEFEKLETLIK